MRPAYPEQIGYSYFQGSLVCDLLVKEWGEKSITALLAEYRAGRTTDEAFQKVTGMSMAAFDRRFDAYMKERFGAALAALALPGPEYPAGMGPAELLARADSFPGSYRAQAMAAAPLLRARMNAEAIRVLERAHALFPAFGGDDSPAGNLAVLYRARGDTAKEVAMLKVVALSDESNYAANMHLASLLILRGDTLGAVEATERALYINPFAPELHNALARLAQARGDHAMRVREREALLALDPVDKADALYELAVAYREAGDLTKAKRAVLRALEDAPNFERAQDLLLAIVDGRKP
jgi:tetratricopeptide (TPR) repeat protein